MALTKCRECEQAVSTEAATCPRCGAPAPTSSPIPLGKCLGCKQGLFVHESARCPHCGMVDPRTPEPFTGVAPAPAPRLSTVVVEDADMHFGTMVYFMVKWVIASIPAFIILGLIYWAVLIGFTMFVPL